MRFHLLFTFILLVTQSTLVATKLKIATFNIEWYGLNDSLDFESRDSRDEHLRGFIKKYLSDTDVIVFTEIVDTKGFKKRVMGNNFSCRTYSHPEPRHQHVLLCHKNQFRFVKERDDNNYKIESVAISSKSRPGLSGVLTSHSGKPLAHFIGVHLKAFPEATAKRLRQTRAISKRIQQFRDKLPIIIIGDFNTHWKENSGERYDDWQLMDWILRKENRLKVRHLSNGRRYTYRNPDRGHQLDQIWMSTSIKTTSKPKVFGACSSKSYSTIERYNEQISDHCPLVVQVEIN